MPQQPRGRWRRLGSNRQQRRWEHDASQEIVSSARVVIKQLDDHAREGRDKIVRNLLKSNREILSKTRFFLRTRVLSTLTRSMVQSYRHERMVQGYVVRPDTQHVWRMKQNSSRTK